MAVFTVKWFTSIETNTLY